MSDSNKNYRQAVKALTNISVTGTNPNLDAIDTVLKTLNNPHKEFDSIQIAGTNGKSSTARYVASILKFHDFKTGLYTSPILYKYTDVIEIDGKQVDQDVFAQSIFEVLEKTPVELSEFEILTSAAFLIFANQDRDVVSLEVGLGGLWDATSIVNPKVAAFTSIGLDHSDFLGDTIKETASIKAGVIDQGTQPILAPQVWKQKDAVDEINHRIKKVNSHPSILVKDPTYKTDPCNKLKLAVQTEGIYDSYTVEVLAPEYQASNIATAIYVCEAYFGKALNEKLINKAVNETKTAGRFEIISHQPLQIIDSAHNPEAIGTLLTTIRTVFPDKEKRPTLLFAVLADKDVENIVKPLAKEFKNVVVTETSSPRALKAEETANVFNEFTGKKPVIYKTVKESLEALENEDYLAVGSITLAGEIKKIIN